MKIIPAIGYIRWFLRNADEFRPILDLPEKWAGAQTLLEKWQVLDEVARIIIPLLSDLLPEFNNDGDVVATHRQDTFVQLAVDLEAKGFTWPQVMDFITTLIEVVELILSQLEEIE